MLVSQNKNNKIQAQEDNPIDLAKGAIKQLVASVDQFVYEYKTTINNNIIESNYKMVFLANATTLQSHIIGVKNVCDNYIADITCSQNEMFDDALHIFGQYNDAIEDARKQVVDMDKGKHLITVGVESPKYSYTAAEMEDSYRQFENSIINVHGTNSNEVICLHGSLKNIFANYSMATVIGYMMVPVSTIHNLINNAICYVRNVKDENQKEIALSLLKKSYDSYLDSNDKYISDASQRFSKMDLSELQKEKDKIVSLMQDNFVCGNCISEFGDFIPDGALIIYKNNKTTENVLNECFYLFTCRKVVTAKINEKIAQLKNLNPNEILKFLPKSERNVDTLLNWLDNFRDNIFYKCQGNVTAEKAVAYLVWVFFEKMELESVPTFVHGAAVSYFNFLKKTGSAELSNANHISAFMTDISGLNYDELKEKQEKLLETSKDLFWENKEI